MEFLGIDHRPQEHTEVVFVALGEAVLGDDVGGAAIASLVYNFFDYAGNDGKLTTADGGEEYFDIEYIAFFETKADAESFAK